MNDSKILIIGSKGQLGTALRDKYPNATAIDADELDITNKQAVVSFDWSNTDIIINAAAYTNVDLAETEQGRISAWQINAEGVANLAGVALLRKLRFVHISTDYVFDGTQSPHLETEPFSPINVYGQSKAAGDIAATFAPHHFIVRTSWVIGAGKNFVRTMLELGKKGVSPTVVADQIGRPTFTSELVRAIDHLLKQDARPGVYNLSNDGQPVSWAELTRQIFAVAGLRLKVTDTTTAAYYHNKTGIAPRPLQSLFDLSKIHATDFHSHDWHDDLSDYVNKELA
jgi:dTDP-4-dehydrorhamnose 3,5-epimerase/reductase